MASERATGKYLYLTDRELTDIEEGRNADAGAGNIPLMQALAHECLWWRKAWHDGQLREGRAGR